MSGCRIQITRVTRLKSLGYNMSRFIRQHWDISHFSSLFRDLRWKNSISLHTVSLLFDVTQQSDSTQDPVVRWQHGGQHHCCDVVQVCSPRFLVDGAHIQLGVDGAGAVNGVHVDDGQEGEEHFGCGLDETGVLPVPAGSIQIQTVDIHSLLFREGTPVNKYKQLLLLLFACF